MEAINSVLAQKPDKYVIYDCGSTDISRKILDSFQDPCMQKILVDSDNGPAQGLNIGLTHLTEDIFYYLNADDRLLPGAFAFVKEYFSLNPSCDILHGSINLINESGKIFKKLPSIGFSLWRYGTKACVVYQQATFIRKKVLESNSFNELNKICWDGELIVDLAIAGAEIHDTKFLLGEFRIHPRSISSSKAYRQKLSLENERISIKIFRTRPTAWEKSVGFLIAKAEAILRKIFNQANHLPAKYHL